MWYFIFHIMLLSIESDVSVSFNELITSVCEVRELDVLLVILWFLFERGSPSLWMCRIDSVILLFLTFRLLAAFKALGQVCPSLDLGIDQMFPRIYPLSTV